MHYIIPKAGMLIRTKHNLAFFEGDLPRIPSGSILLITQVEPTMPSVKLDFKFSFPPNYHFQFLFREKTFTIMVRNTAIACDFAERFEVLSE